MPKSTPPHLGNPPAEFAAQFKSDIARFAKAIEQAPGNARY